MELLFFSMILALLNLSNKNTVASEKKDDIEIIESKVIDISRDYVIQSILRDAVNQDSLKNCVNYYILRYGVLNNGTLIKIAEYNDSILNHNIYFKGCILWNGKRVIVIGDQSYRFEFDHSEKKIPVYREIDRDLSNSNEVNPHYYYILGDIWAKFSPNKSWIWSDGKSDK